jgi:hypothetical protein
MMETKPEPLPGLPPSEEQELKELLDRVLAASTTQPLREDLAKLLPEVEELVAQSVGTAQKRLTHNITTASEGLRERVEAEFDALRRRLTERIEESGQDLHELQTREFASTKEALSQLDKDNSSNLENLKSRLDALEVSSKEHLKAELTVALQSASQQLVNHLEQSHSDIKESLKAIQSQQVQAAQQSLRWQEDNRAKDERFEREQRELAQQLLKMESASQKLLWFTLLAVAANGLAWAYFFFGR